MITLGIAGICGKMGTRIHLLANQDKDFKVTVGLESSGHPQVNSTVNGVKVTADPLDIKSCDCFIDFTTPDATIAHLEHLVTFKKCAVIGTTGLTESQTKAIEAASKSIPIVFSPNMSVGVGVLFNLARVAAKNLQGYSISIREAHHATKKDAPSGTAKKIAAIINKEGFTIKNQDIHVLREGEIIGDHKIVFESDVDRIELSHCAKTRDIFAKGALRAAKWLATQKAGLYSMEDIVCTK
jgi:4-hydroxy-tetrahydrodipicolinate reductase